MRAFLAVSAAVASATLPFLVQYQHLTLGGAGDGVEVLLVTYRQVTASELRPAERSRLTGILQRVATRWHEAGAAGRAGLVREYLDVAVAARTPSCAEALFRWPDGEGLRYRTCSSPRGDAVRLLEDMTLPDRLLWLELAGDAEAMEQLGALLEKALAPPERGAPRRAGGSARERLLTWVRGLEPEELPPVYVEANGSWREVEQESGAVAEAMAALWSELSPGFAARATLAFRFLRFLGSDAAREIRDAGRGGGTTFPFTYSGLDLDRLLAAIERTEGETARLRASVKAWSGTVPGFEPLPEELAARFYPGGRWAPPEPGRSFSERVDRLERGRGW